MPVDSRVLSDNNNDMEAIIHIDDQLFARAQEAAAAAGQSVDAVIAQALTATLPQEPQPSSKKEFCFTRYRGKGLMPGVNLDNSAELLDIMEEGLDVSRRR
jgi:hypothetical protein